MTSDEKLLTFAQVKRVAKNLVAQAVLKGDFFTPEMHRMIFRGKNLGDTLTSAQKRAIKSGTFEDLWLGDYWQKNGVNYRIADIDYWYRRGETSFLKHHLVITTDTTIGPNKPMNETFSTEGGYEGSFMRASGMNEAISICVQAFGENILSHMEIFPTTFVNGVPAAVLWRSSTIELLTERMVYGARCFAPSPNGVDYATMQTVGTAQLALFAVAPKFIILDSQIYWLQDVAATGYFAVVFPQGCSGSTYANRLNVGIRPVFAVGVPD